MGHTVDDHGDAEIAVPLPAKAARPRVCDAKVLSCTIHHVVVTESQVVPHPDSTGVVEIRRCQPAPVDTGVWWSGDEACCQRPLKTRAEEPFAERAAAAATLLQPEAPATTALARARSL